MAEEKVEETPAPQSEVVKPKSDAERLGDVFDRFTSQEAAEEAATAETPAAEESPAKVETKPADDGKAKEEVPAVPERVVVSADQLGDYKYWDGLDEAGWERMTRDYPVETENVRRAKAAAVKKYNAVRDEASARPAEQRHEAPSEEEPSAELIAAVEMSQDLDPKVAAKGHLEIARLTASTVLKEGGIDPQVAKRDAILTDAITIAAKKIPPEQLADFRKINLTDLEPIAEESAVLSALVDTGTAENIGLAIAESYRIHVERKTTAAAAKKAADDKAAADLKKKENQKIVLSNANPASAAVLKPHGATPDTRTARERLAARFDKEIARQGGGGNA